MYLVHHSNSINFPGSRNDKTSRTTPEVHDHEYKFPRVTVSELNGRIAQTNISPFNRFRSQRGMLSVRPVLIRFDLQVTDLVGLDWCETKFHYALEGGKRRKTDGIRVIFHF
jgi:hypothetical protein